jgi:very-short-patch-repair endonuclease
MDEPTVFRGHHRRVGLVKVAHGLYRDVDAPDPELAELAAWQLVLPQGGRFTHLTAAAVYGWWLPHPLPSLPVFAAVPHDGPWPRRRGLAVRRTARGEPEVRRGLRLDPPAEVLLACAGDLALLDLLVLVDSALGSRACVRAEVDEVARTGRPGATELAEALEWSDARSESAPETLLRALHRAVEVDVVPQHEVRDDRGDLVARGDLWVVGTQVLVELDGDVHLPVKQQRKDLDRSRRLNAVGWERRGYTTHDLVTRAIAVLRDADRAIGRSHDSSRIRAWHALLAESVLSAAGRARLESRFAHRSAGSPARDRQPVH